jgi:predicted ester cyclase
MIAMRSSWRRPPRSRHDDAHVRDLARAAFPDLAFRVDRLIEKDDLVVSNWMLTGTHTGDAFYDVPPSGEPVTINGTAILRVRDGRIVEHWGGPHCQAGIGLRPGS